MIFPQLDTPQVLVDLDVVEKNIQRYQKWCNEHDLKLRPHIKTHKLPLIAKKQIEAGACGITCQKLSEAVAIIKDTQINDVLITYNIVGDMKFDVIRQLADSINLTVTADSATVAKNLNKVFSNARKPLDVMAECDTGAQRCGVLTPKEALELARFITDAPNLRFKGLMTYPPVGREPEVQAWLEEAVQAIAHAGIDVPIVSVGGSPGMWKTDQIPIATEWRPGTYVYCDRSMVSKGVCSIEDCAATVLSTVVSTPEPTRVIIDAGSKVLTSDLLGLNGHGMVLGHPAIQIDNLSEEHGRLVSQEPINLQVGDRVRIVPNHICTVVNMLDHVSLVRKDDFVDTTEVVARGCVW